MKHPTRYPNAFLPSLLFPLLFAALLALAAQPAQAAAPRYLGNDANLASTAEAPAAPWRHEFIYRADRESLSSAAVADGVAVFGARDFHLHAVDVATGALRWRYRTNGPVDATPCIADGVVYAGSRDGRFYALRAADGKLLFRRDLASAMSSSALVVGPLVVVATESGMELVAMDKATGETVWSAALGQPSNSSPATDGTRLFVATSTGSLFAFDLAGNPLWNFATATGGGGFQSPAVKDGKVFYAPGSMDKNLYCLDAATGALDWTYSGGATGASPAPSPVENVRIGQSHASRIRNLKKTIESGEFVAKSGAPSRSAGRPVNYYIAPVDPALVFTSQSVAVDGTSAYFVTGYPTAYLVAVDLATRARRWNRNLGIFPEPVGHYPTPLLAGANLITIDANGSVFTVNPATGLPGPGLTLYGPAYGNPVAADGRLYFVTRDGALVSFGAGPNPALAGSDTVAPALEFVTPANGSTVTVARPQILIRVQETESGVDGATVALTLDGTPLVPTFDRFAARITCTPDPLANGPHTLAFSVSDLAGNGASGSVSFTVSSVELVDSLPPVFADLSPAADAQIPLGFFPRIAARITDAGGSGIDPDAVFLTVDGRAVRHALDETEWIVSHHVIEPLLEGTHTVALQAQDYAGNVSEPFSWIFHVAGAADADLPLASAQQPADGSTVTATRSPLLSVTLADAGSGIDPASCVLRVDGTIVDTSFDAATGRLSGGPSAPLADGAHTVSLYASDLAGNVLTESWSFTVALSASLSRIRVASITADSAAVSWSSSLPSTGKVVYSTSADLAGALEANDDLGAAHVSARHLVTLSGLAPDTDYHFQAVSTIDGTPFTAGAPGAAYRFRTASGAGGAARAFTARLLSEGAPVAGALAHLTVRAGSGAFRLPLVARSGADGLVAFDLALVRDASGASVAPASGDRLRLFACAGEDAIGWRDLPLPDGISAIDAGDLALGAAVDYAFPEATGIFLAGLPVVSDPRATAFGLLAAHPGLSEISRFDAGNQMFETAARALGEPSGGDFQLLAGQGAALRLSGAGITLSGTPVAAAPLELSTGLNLVAFPHAAEGPDLPRVGLDSRAFLERSANLIEIHRFDPATQRFDQAAFRAGGLLLGSRFDLSVEEAYFVRAAGPLTLDLPAASSFGPAAQTAPAPALAAGRAAPNRAARAASPPPARLVPPHLAFGRLLNASGEPAAGVELTLRLSAAAGPPLSARTDADGVWVVNLADLPGFAQVSGRAPLRGEIAVTGGPAVEADLAGDSPLQLPDLTVPDSTPKGGEAK